MSEGEALVHFHNCRTARDRKAATRRLWAAVREAPFEITFFAVGNISKGGDAILIRWAPPSRREQYVLIDGDYKGDFPAIRGYPPRHIDHVICSHLDQNHISGLIELLKDKSKNIGALWLTCPESLITDDVLLAPASAQERRRRSSPF
jgi:beta-lactamase superfamily II metal-dependent hydrolase